MIRRPTKAEFAEFAKDSEAAAERFDEAAIDAREAAESASAGSRVHAQLLAMAELHRQHAADAREDAAMYREGRVPGEDM